MDNQSAMPGLPSLAQEMQLLRNHWRWFLALGIAMVCFGMVAIGSATVATKVATWLFGFLLLTGGIAQIVSAFWAGRWSGTLAHLLIGILYTVAGLMITDRPEDAAIELTLIMAIFFIVSGLFRIVFALSERFTGWGWVLLNGVVTLLLGLLVYKQWPIAGLWIIGLFIGIELIFNGWAWIMLSLGLRETHANDNA